ncbi:PepSY-associated TM helix domain-containing protein [Cecembia rubra]|uniref:PepSY-associated transmembrane protein n=1 Tax=Cecembia rubra TaxID=1485585 RepID=A0A2P8EEB0_9BACT|nr:PepSY-associated TM helix domain-containing protein [Cecembia rubra]PSL07812.1 PepSY-associated transmembrane protein [Cecembia rubra]
MKRISIIANLTRIHRRIHKWVSIPFVFFLILIGVTAILLAWKKELHLIPKTQKTKMESPSTWIPVEKILEIGSQYMRDSLHKESIIDRLDIRPEKGIVKIIFKYHFTEVQIDGYSGEILSVAQRNSDLIEKIHDGSILDFWGRSDSESSKQIYSTLTSLALIVLGISGFYLWYNPKRMKKIKKGS